ncbi:MAG TPA: histidinol-phosphate transaminase [Rhizobacter sp.]|nr:histidinol-phosphate transaminase [Rhizobacter sp.]
MSIYWSDIVHRLTPYVPGEQPQIGGLIKLNTNENPYPPSPRVLEAIRAEVGDTLRLYPEPTGKLLRTAVAQQMKLQPEQVFVGNSSDEVLAHVFMGLLNHGPRPLLMPDIGYAFYPVYCGLYGIANRKLPLDAQLQLNIDDYLQPEAGAIIFANPNAPTGRGLPRAEIERLLAARPDTVVVVDEAYVDFGGESAVPLIDAYPNLLVVHTLSKSRSLAGLRVGYALGHAALIEALTRVKDSFNSYPLDRLATAGAIAAMDDVHYFERTRRAVIDSRERLSESLSELGFEVLPSQANFLFARHPAHQGAELAAALRERSILVRRFDHPARIADHLRITIGTDAQCDALVKALTEITHAAV